MAKDRVLHFHSCPYCDYQFTRGVAQMAGLTLNEQKHRHIVFTHPELPDRPWHIVNVPFPNRQGGER